MKIYHGTSSRFLNSILKKGIIPRRKRNGHWEDYPSHPDMAYLSIAYPFYFAACTADNDELSLVLEIDTDLLDEKLFYPDEDFIAQGLAGPSGDLNKIHNTARRNLAKFRDYWQESINRMGNCCYKGVIPPKAIMRYCLFDRRQRPTLNIAFLDPAISIINYTFMNAKYKGMVQWMFGDIHQLPMATAEGFFGPPLTISDDIKNSIQKELNFWEDESKNRTGIELRNLR